MGYRMKGSAFKLNNVATKSALKKAEEKELTEEEKAANLAYAARPKWWENEDGTENTDLLKERGFTWDSTAGRWRHATQKNLMPSQWKNRMSIGDQRRHTMTTDKAEGGKRLLTEEEQYE